MTSLPHKLTAGKAEKHRTGELAVVAPRAGQGRKVALQSAALAAALTGAVLTIHRLNPRSFVGYHGLVHTAIVQSVLDGDIPPDNPLATGLPLPYYWTYHVLLAGIVRLAGCTAVGAAEAVNAFALAGVVLLLGWLSQRLTRSSLTGLVAAIIALFAVNPLGPLFALHDLTNGSLSLSIGAFACSPSHPLLRAMYPDYGVRWGSGFFFFLQPSSRGAAFLAALAAATMVCTMPRRSWRHVLGIGLAIAIACSMNPIVGVGAACSLSLAVVVARVSDRWRSPDQTRERIPVIAAIAALVTGAFVALPTYHQLLTGHSVGLPLETHLGMIAWKGLHVGLFGAIPIVMVVCALRRRLLADARLQTLAIAGSALLFVSWLGHVPLGREHSFFNLAMFFFALPAATLVGSSAADRRTRAIGWTLLTTSAPVAMLSVGAMLYRAPIPLHTDGSRLIDGRDADLATTYAWIADQTPRRAALMFDLRDGQQCNLYGPESEVPAMTGRRLFIDLPGWCLPADPRVDQRREIVASVFDGAPLTPRQNRAIDEVGRPLLALCRTPEDEEGLRASGGQCLFHQGRYAVYRCITATESPTTE